MAMNHIQKCESPARTSMDLLSRSMVQANKLPIPLLTIMVILCFTLAPLSSANATNVQTPAGKDVNMHCLATIKADEILSITSTQSDGTTLFRCNGFTIPCETNTTIHTFGRNDTFISSTVTIRNVSLVHEDEYDTIMLSLSDRQTCKINLTVNVPPKGLILVEKVDGTFLQNQRSLTVAEGENKTLICKTNASVDLEWEIPNGLNAYVESQKNSNDEHDTRLLVPTRTIHFTPTYAFDEDIVLVCKVASNPSFDNIQTAVLITNEDELTTSTKGLMTGLKETRTSTASSGASLVSSFLKSTTDDSLQSCQCYFQPIWILYVVAVCSLMQVLFVVIAYSIVKKRQGLASLVMQTSGNLPVDDTSQTNEPASTSGVKPLDHNLDQSDPTYATPDVSEVPHTYMAMKPIRRCKSRASTTQQVSYPTTSVVHHVSPTPVRKQAHVHSNLKEEPTYLNAEGAFTYCEISTDVPNIVDDYTEGRDNVSTTYL